MSAHQQQQSSSPDISRLEELFGLTIEQVQDVIMAGVHARTNGTPHHPKTYPGYAQWAETVRSLRDVVVPLGWAVTDKNNFPLCVHEERVLSIAVQTGDRETGTTGIPSNRAPKGASTEAAVAVNVKQLSLFEAEDIPILPSATDDARHIMWILLYHVAQNEVRFELSLPSKIVGGKIRSWQERIIFPAIPLGETQINFGDDDGPEFDVSVERKG
ncbi:hypothetical protein [Pseudoduganella chitinolytica]|uniref:Uncharacterized protein n=1 Tax=Pseudoduganella chitinolytica TaxID=34070 RepID=A0ABY8B7P6_9BURK|nr:hypothetical protein [Pseudoduganella chitinolytica]WEF31825.1 hypothetical protein PX653_20665 [Pseudoduganella chitinolytica]